MSNITYWKTGFGVLYISLITDAFSHKITGWHAAQTLKAAESLKALKMALDSLNEPTGELIHHSDRGLQYCSHEYVKLFQDNNIRISMAENGNSLENAITEPVNGITKDDYLECYQVSELS